MHKETFFLDGKNALDYGIHLQNPIVFSEAEPVYDAETIPGRNGDLIFETGSFENRTAEADCFILQNAAYSAVGMANKFLLARRGHRRLQTSDDPEHYWLAVVENGVEVENRKNVLIPFSVSFDCKPQRFLLDGENPMNFYQNGVVFNRYGFEALPKITVFGNGSGRLRVGDAVVEIHDIAGTLVLDSETQNAYNEFSNRNNYINAPEFPLLKDGENHIEFSGGIERIEIVPRWWEL